MSSPGGTSRPKSATGRSDILTVNGDCAGLKLCVNRNGKMARREWFGMGVKMGRRTCGRSCSLLKRENNRGSRRKKLRVWELASKKNTGNPTFPTDKAYRQAACSSLHTAKCSPVEPTELGAEAMLPVATTMSSFSSTAGPLEPFFTRREASVHTISSNLSCEAMATANTQCVEDYRTCRTHQRSSRRNR